MHSRYHFTALAFISLSAGVLWVNPIRAETAPPFKVDPRLLGFPALEQTDPPPARATPQSPGAEGTAETERATTPPPVTTQTTQPKPNPAAQPAETLSRPPAPPPSVVKPLPATTPVQPVALPPADKPTVAAPPAKPNQAIQPVQVEARIPSQTALPPNDDTSCVRPTTNVAANVKTPKAAQVVSPPVAFSAGPPGLPPAKIDDMTLRLQATPTLVPHPTQPEEETPLFIAAMRLQSNADSSIEAEEDVELRKLGLRVNADAVRYDPAQETLDAKGNVRIQTDTGVIKGPDLHYKVPDGTGFMSAPAFALGGAQGQGSGSKLTFLSDERYQLDDAKYSTCAPGKEEWWIHASELEIDRSTNTGTGRNAWIEFKGVPFLYTPYITFPLRNERKSGFLTPSFATSNTRGIEFTVPYYWNIAPNLDATITPRVLTKRGVQLGADFRYLQPNYSGEIQGETLPNDRVTQTTRNAFRLNHVQNFGAGFSGNIDFQKVSDNNYFRDLSTLIAATSKTTLLREGNLSYGYGPFSANLKVQRFQILQDPAAPIAEPYERVPQLTAAYRKLNAFGFADVAASSEYVEYIHPTSVRGSRFTLNPSFSVPLTRAYGYITPKFGVHHTQYKLEQSQNTARLPDTTRTLPIFSLDSGLTFEREASLFGRGLTQTLEPRLFYLYVPFKDQNRIPLFDSGETDFTFAQIFSENRFSGGDRISDANQVTLALTSRFIEGETGLERLRATVAQRYFFRTPRVTISPTTRPPEDKTSDFLASIGGQISPAWSADATVQYNPNIGRNEKYNVGARYNPEPGKLANATYRYTRDALHQIDLSGQWPVAPGWQVLGRWNFSIQDRRSLETLAGFEYQACCWAVRVVAHRFQTATQQATNALFLQLELSGLSSLGTNPFNTLKQNIGGYSQTQPLLQEINLNEF